jgi:hypothetical protein
MKKLLFSLIMVVVLGLIGFLLLFQEDPYDKIRRSEPEKGQNYLSNYSKSMNHKKFELLLKRLITDNMDLKSIGVAVTYVVTNKLCEFIPDIESKCNLLSRFPIDTIWKVNISKTITKQWTPNEVGLGYSMCDRLEKLMRNCGK